MTVYAPLLGTIWRTLESYGIEPHEVIPDKLYRPGGQFTYSDRIRFEDYDAIQARVASMVKDPAMGLKAGLFLHPSHLGAFGYAWLASSCLRTALKRAQRFVRMSHEHIEVCLDEQPDHVRVFHRMRRIPTRPNISGDAQIAGTLTMCRSIVGDHFAPQQVTLRRETPSDPTPWIEALGEKIVFGHALNSLVISADDADRELTSSSPNMVKPLEGMIERYLIKLDRESVANRARVFIMKQLPSGRVTQLHTAEALNVSKRTLQRKLRENDLTFRSLLTQVRMDMAERYLEIPGYSFTEIAFLLGYTDTSAFSRAFKSWFGHSPTTARKLEAA